jgi:hypothetical protein
MLPEQSACSVWQIESAQNAPDHLEPGTGSVKSLQLPTSTHMYHIYAGRKAKCKQPEIQVMADFYIRLRNFTIVG